VPTYPLHANLSPRIARRLAATFGIDAVSLFDQGLERLSDEQVVALAQRLGRVVITLDEDFTRIFAEQRGAVHGIIYLDLPNTHRRLRAVTAILEAFFRDHAVSIDFEDALVRVTDKDVTVNRKS
jgi:predicted nuclease of predicted toxin-antitoxin system